MITLKTNEIILYKKSPQSRNSEYKEFAYLAGNSKAVNLFIKARASKADSKRSISQTLKFIYTFSLTPTLKLMLACESALKYERVGDNTNLSY